MLVLTWNAYIKHEPAELVTGAAQKQMNAEASARKTWQVQNLENTNRNGAFEDRVIALHIIVSAERLLLNKPSITEPSHL